MSKTNSPNASIEEALQSSGDLDSLLDSINQRQANAPLARAEGSPKPAGLNPHADGFGPPEMLVGSHLTERVKLARTASSKASSKRETETSVDEVDLTGLGSISKPGRVKAQAVASERINLSKPSQFEPQQPLGEFVNAEGKTSTAGAAATDQIAPVAGDTPPGSAFPDFTSLGPLDATSTTGLDFLAAAAEFHKSPPGSSDHDIAPSPDGLPAVQLHEVVRIDPEERSPMDLSSRAGVIDATVRIVPDRSSEPEVAVEGSTASVVSLPPAEQPNASPQREPLLAPTPISTPTPEIESTTSNDPSVKSEALQADRFTGQPLPAEPRADALFIGVSTPTAPPATPNPVVLAALSEADDAPDLVDALFHRQQEAKRREELERLAGMFPTLSPRTQAMIAKDPGVPEGEGTSKAPSSSSAPAQVLSGGSVETQTGKGTNPPMASPVPLVTPPPGLKPLLPGSLPAGLSVKPPVAPEALVVKGAGSMTPKVEPHHEAAATPVSLAPKSDRDEDVWSLLNQSCIGLTADDLIEMDVPIETARRSLRLSPYFQAGLVGALKHISGPRYSEEIAKAIAAFTRETYWDLEKAEKLLRNVNSQAALEVVRKISPTLSLTDGLPIRVTGEEGDYQVVFAVCSDQSIQKIRAACPNTPVAFAVVSPATMMHLLVTRFIDVDRMIRQSIQENKSNPGQPTAAEDAFKFLHGLILKAFSRDMTRIEFRRVGPAMEFWFGKGRLRQSISSYTSVMFDAITQAIKSSSNKRPIAYLGIDLGRFLDVEMRVYGPDAITVKLRPAEPRLSKLESLNFEPKDLRLLGRFAQSGFGVGVLTGLPGNGREITALAMAYCSGEAVRWVRTAEEFQTQKRQRSFILVRVPNPVQDMALLMRAFQAGQEGHRVIVVSDLPTVEAFAAAVDAAAKAASGLDIMAKTVLRFVLALRYVPLLCTQCALPDGHQEDRGDADPKYKRLRAVGCGKCYFTGHADQRLFAECWWLSEHSAATGLSSVSRQNGVSKQLLAAVNSGQVDPVELGFLKE